MKFYNRQQEIHQLQQWSKKAAEGQGLLTLLVGRRRIGKTALIATAYGSCDLQSIYLFTSRKQESLLTEEFAEQIRAALNISIYGNPTKLKDIIAILLEYSRTHAITLIIDEFQDLQRVNRSFFSELQNLWDAHKADSRMHLICCGSLYSLMTRLFQDSREPLFGRADNRINLQPLRPYCIAELLENQHQYTPEKLLQWYALSGGVPKYLQMLAQTEPNLDLWEQLINNNSLMIEEGHYRLAEEFGLENNRYFSILSAISAGRTSRPEIEALLETSVGPQLERLEKDFDIIKRQQPIFSKPGNRLIRYRIADTFLAFWFRFIYSHRSAIEIRNFTFVRKIIERDYPTWSGQWLEELVRQSLADTGHYSRIGSYWERGNSNEIDIVALNEINKTALIAEVKRNRKNIRISKLKAKASNLTRQLHDYDITFRGFSLEDLPILVESASCK